MARAATRQTSGQNHTEESGRNAGLPGGLAENQDIICQICSASAVSASNVTSDPSQSLQAFDLLDLQQYTQEKDLATIGTLALILVYGGVTGTELAESLGARRLIRALFGLTGMLVLPWPLYNSVYPIPDFPRNLWPCVVIAWIFADAVLLVVRPGLVLADDSAPSRFRQPVVGENSRAVATRSWARMLSGVFTRFHTFSRGDGG